jgi:DHA3 family tetracycline resistance protein-like MFS transporter
MLSRFRKLNAALVYYVLTGGITLAQGLMFTILAIYYVNEVGMNPLQLVLVGTMVEGTILLFEVPTGAVADTYSRRLSVIIGMFILGAAWLVQGSFALFGMVLLSEFIRGVGETFLSGALDAWLAGEVGEENIGKIYVRSGQINRIIGILGILGAVGVASLQLNWAILGGGALFLLLGLFLVLFMPENGFEPAPQDERNSLGTVGQTLRSGARAIRGSRLLLLLLLVSAVGGAASEGFDRLWEVHLIRNFTFPAIDGFTVVVWFGAIKIAMSLAGLLVTESLRARLERATRSPAVTARILLVLNTLSMGAIFAFALAGNFPAAFVFVLIKSVLSGLFEPLYYTWLVQSTEPKVRATMLSMINQSNALGQVALGPAVGAVGTFVSIRAALVAASVLLAPITALFAGASKSQPEPEREAVAPEG